MKYWNTVSFYKVGFYYNNLLALTVMKCTHA